jgi:hypothetical protein
MPGHPRARGLATLVGRKLLSNQYYLAALLSPRTAAARGGGDRVDLPIGQARQAPVLPIGLQHALVFVLLQPHCGRARHDASRRFKSAPSNPIPHND